MLYGLGAVAFGVKDNGFSFFLLLYYNQVLGLPESWVGLGIMLALMADAVFDPVVGYLSDHLHSRWGRRHPFLYASAVPAAVAYWFLWNPPAGLSHESLLAYFLGVSVLVRVFVAVNEIPSASLVPELTDKLRRAHVDPELSFLLRLVGRPRDDRPGVRGLSPARRDASGGRAEPRGIRHLRPRRLDHDVCGHPRLRDRHPRLHPVSQAPAGEATCRARGRLPGADGDPVEPLVPGAVRGEHLRRHGGRTHRRARHLHQHVLLGADVEPDIDSRPRLLRLGRARGGGRSGSVTAHRKEARRDRDVARGDPDRAPAGRAPAARPLSAERLAHADPAALRRSGRSRSRSSSCPAS